MRLDHTPSTSAWLYTRGHESIRIEVRDEGLHVGLLVFGPGPHRQFIPCADAWSVIESQIAQEAHLLAQGYALERFTADRRTAPPRWESAPVPVEILQRRERSRS